MTKCPQCGYNELPVNNNRHSVMTAYVTPDGKRKAIMNHVDEELNLTSGEGEKKVTVKWIREDVYNALPKVSAPAPKAPSVPPATK